MKHQFKILFYVKRNQPLKSGKLSIICRISINGESGTFSTHLAVAAKAWDEARKRVKGRNKEAQQINALLDNIYYTLYKIYMRQLGSGEGPTPHSVRAAYFGGSTVANGVVDFFRRHNREFEKMVGITRRPSTLYKYRYVCNHLQQFIHDAHHMADIPLSKVNRDMICDFHHWLIDEVKCSVNTARIYLTAFKHILMLAMSRGYISQNPFLGYQLRSEPTMRSFLMREELRRMIALKPRNKNEATILDAFIFGCFTGLSYSDIAILSMRDIICSDRHWYIATRRIKTSTSVNVPLLQLPIKILKKYYQGGDDAPLFPLPSNCWCNRVLKDMAQRANISKRVTFHVARHTFATTVTLSYGVPIEAVSRMLGHTDIKTTQIYAKILESVVNSEMQRASDRINVYFQDY